MKGYAGSMGRAMGLASNVQGNRLLAALPPTQLQRLLPLLEPVDLPLGHVLCESGSTMSHAYFPATGLVSLLYVTEDGAPGEIALVGSEGVVGVALFMGVTRRRAAPSRTAPARACGWRYPS